MVVYEIPDFKYPIRGRQKSVSLILATEGAVGVVIAFDKNEKMVPSLTNSIEHLYKALREKVKEGTTLILVEAGHLVEGKDRADYTLVRFDAEGKPYWTILGYYRLPPSEEELVEIVERARKKYLEKVPGVQSGTLSESLTEVERIRKGLEI